MDRSEAHRDLTLHDIAARAAVSVRTLNRRFQAETGQTPMQWLIGVRVRHAQQLLESTAYGVDGRARGRIHLTGQLPRAVPSAHRGGAAELPQHFPRPHGGLRATSRTFVQHQMRQRICICSGAAANRCATPASS